MNIQHFTRKMNNTIQKFYIQQIMMKQQDHFKKKE